MSKADLIALALRLAEIALKALDVAKEQTLRGDELRDRWFQAEKEKREKN